MVRRDNDANQSRQIPYNLYHPLLFFASFYSLLVSSFAGLNSRADFKKFKKDRQSQSAAHHPTTPIHHATNARHPGHRVYAHPSSSVRPCLSSHRTPTPPWPTRQTSRRLHQPTTPKQVSHQASLRDRNKGGKQTGCALLSRGVRVESIFPPTRADFDVLAWPDDASAAMEDVQEPASGESKQAPEGGEGGEDEEDESEEKKEKTPRKPRAKKEAAATPAAAPASAGTSSRGRERKSVVAYVPQSPKFSQSDELLPVEAGPGTPLGEIENVKHRLDITHATDAEVKALFHAAYPNSKTGHTKKVVKANIRAFSGYPKAQADQLAEAAVVRLEKNSTEILRLVAQMCDLGHSAPRAKLIEHIVDFLRKPKSSGAGLQLRWKEVSMARGIVFWSWRDIDCVDNFRRARTGGTLLSGSGGRRGLAALLRHRWTRCRSE